MSILEYFRNTNIRNKYIVCIAEEGCIHEKTWYFSTTFYVCHNAAWLIEFLHCDFIKKLNYAAIAVYCIDYDGKMYRFISCRKDDKALDDFRKAKILSLEDIEFEPTLLNEENLIK